MAISRIKTDGIQDEAVTSAKIGDNIDLDGQFVRVPHGTTAERPGSPAAGYLRFNTTLGTLEQWNTNTNSWAAIDSPPIITSITGGTALDPAGGETVTVNGSNFKSGAIISVNGTNQTTSFVSTTQVTFVTSATAAGDYDVKLTNPNGLSATSTNAVSFNGLPAFSSPAAGAISGNYASGSPIPTITIVASEPDGGTIAYSITSGSLPPGTTLDSAAGTITGTPTNTATTNYPFTVTATDDESQTSTRNFTLNVLRPVYTNTISNSLVLDDGNSQGLNWSPASDGNLRLWTMSFWVKPNNMTDSEMWLAGTSSDRTRLEFGGSTGTTGRIMNFAHIVGGTNRFGFSLGDAIEPNDQAGWYHVVVQWNTAQATAADRFKLWINGTYIDMAASWVTNSGTDGTYITQNRDSIWNRSAFSHYIGYRGYQNSNYFDGTISDWHFCDGYGYSHTDFGEWYNGAWVPKQFTGSYGTNGFHLDFSDYTAPETDAANSNNWTRAGTFGLSNNPTRSVVTDSPTQNYPVFNQRWWRYQGPNTTNGGVRAIATTDHVIGTTMMMPRGSGKYYFEVEMENVSGGNNNYATLVSEYSNIHDRSFLWLNAASVVGGSNTTGSALSQTTLTGLSYVTGDYVMVAVDTDNEKIFFGVNGTWGTGTTGAFDPTSASSDDVIASMGYDWGAIFGDQSKYIGYAFTDGNSTSAHRQVINFGQRPFQGTMPTGYKHLNSKNLPEPGVGVNPLFGNKWQNALGEVNYTGNAGTNAVTGMGFQPDLIIAKATNSGQSWRVFDAVKTNPTTDFNFFDNNTNSSAAGLSYDSDGFTWNGGGANANDSAVSYIAWGFKGANGTTTNTNGATSSVVSANPDAGFSIVRWSGAGAATTVGHGLNSAPTFIITKNLSKDIAWRVYHKNTGNTKALIISSDSIGVTGSQYWNNTSPTNSVFSVGTEQNLGGDSGSAGDEIIAYCWTDIQGYIATGEYQGGQTGENSFVYTGFAPKFLLIKNVTGTVNNWMLVSPQMIPYWGANTNLIRPNLPDGYLGGSERIRFFTNGFVPGPTNGLPNDSGRTHVYLAIGEPFKYNNAQTSNGNFFVDG